MQEVDEGRAGASAKACGLNKDLGLFAKGLSSWKLLRGEGLSALNFFFTLLSANNMCNAIMYF